MAVFNYQKYKISLAPNSCKTQGLRAGDIVRRQYYDNQLQKEVEKDSEGNIIGEKYTGQRVGNIYNLMCVLETGVDLIDQYLEDGTLVTDVNGNPLQVQQQWFIGALLDGVDTPPKSDEILDFVRITNLFDTDRSGALYLTASDAESPFMDVIDGIGRDSSLCWPEDISTGEAPDCETQYNVKGDLLCKYTPTLNLNNRVLSVTRTSGSAPFSGLQQDFYKYVSNPNMVLVSYKANASENLALKVSLGYTDGIHSDTNTPIEVELNAGEWKYCLHAITVDWSGRHLRTLTIDMSELNVGANLQISDFNIILLSSLTGYDQATKSRFGNLEGVVDPVFGKLSGFGGYLQKLFASRCAHISGTLTAGDENGFGSSFYAGKIHKNVLVNSLGLDTLEGVVFDNSKTNPTGIGNTIKIQTSTTIVAQSNQWLLERIGKTYTFSFWVYTETPCVLELSQNDTSIGALYVNVMQTHQWVRLYKTFELSAPDESTSESELYICIAPIFKEVSDPIFGEVYNNIALTSESDATTAHHLLFTAPQLESGYTVSQYQPTDEVLSYTEDYGAWFNRGGIGGTIQNPLLRLNYDGNGGIATRPTGPNNEPSLVLNQDGSGHVAQGKIRWDENGNVVFDKDVYINWDNLGDDTKSQLVHKAIKIVGADSFTLIGDDIDEEPTMTPESIVLSLEETNLTSSSETRCWKYLDGVDWVDFPEGLNNGKTLRIYPYSESPDYWKDLNQLTVRCVVNFYGQEFTDTFTIRKFFIEGYTLELVSSRGSSFKNNSCSTRLTGNVYYQGQLLDKVYCQERFQFKWTKYNIINGEMVEDNTFWSKPGVVKYLDPAHQEIELDYVMSGTDYFVCELVWLTHFPYSFPISF